MLVPLLWLLFFMKAVTGHAYNAVETEMFSIPISPNLFNWTYQEFDQQYRFHASLIGKPELPTWLRYIYSGRHHSGFIFGTPPRNTESPITIEVIGLNRQDYETRRVLLTLTIQAKEKLAKHEVEFKIDNLNVEDLLDEHRMTRLKNILRTKLWTESGEDLYATFLASAIDLGARLPLKPSDGEGLVIRLGSTVALSSELKRLREEVRPLSRLPSCPREYKRTTVERLFRDAGFTLDWCSFELYNTIYTSRSTDHLEYLTEIPSPKSVSRSLAGGVWSAPSRGSIPSRSYSHQLVSALAAPVLLLLLSVAALTAVLCFHYAAVSDPESDVFLEDIYHICEDYRNRRLFVLYVLGLLQINNQFDQQYRFHASLIGKPELPTWLRYIYSGRHHSGFIFGTPPRNTESPITIEVIGLNRQDYETRRVLLTLTIQAKEKLAKHEVEFKIDNLNVEDLLDEHRMTRLKNILRTKLWTESGEDLYATFLASAIDLGARLPLKPSDGEGLVIRLGSTVALSSELKRLREEVRPLSRLPSCPREYKRTTVERLFRDAGFTLDWCSFELYNTIYTSRSTDHLEYLTEIPSPKSVSRSLAGGVWSAPSRGSIPSRSYSHQLVSALAAPVLLLLLSVAALTAVLCFHYAAVSDPESDVFLEDIYHICEDYRNRRAHKSANVEICRYGTSNTENTQATQADNTSSKSLGVSPNSSLVRPYSPKSTSNLAGNYNRPQPPPYGTLHHRKPDKTPDNRSHSLEESLKLLNEANITNEFERDPIIDYSDGTDDYIQIKPDRDYIIQDKMQNDLDDIVVPELAKYGISGIGPI